ncbi:MAG: hypothetical protein HY558_03115 [Euryarchaeota archaeon]|nr:hypothetical protein [Euryarchaeota archaeon]
MALESPLLPAAPSPADRGALEVSLEEHRRRWDALRAQAAQAAQQRDTLNLQVRQAIEQAHQHRDQRDGYNRQVSRIKEQRDPIERRIRDLEKQVEATGRDFPEPRGWQSSEEKTGGHGSIPRLQEETERLEFQQQTQVLSPDRERKIIERIAELRRELKRRQDALRQNQALQALVEELIPLKGQAAGMRRELARLSRTSQEHHHKMAAAFEEADRLRLQADQAHQEHLRIQGEADGAHREVTRLQRELRGLDHKAAEERRRAVQEGDKETAERIFEQFKQGAKLGTEDLLLLQRSGLL